MNTIMPTFLFLLWPFSNVYSNSSHFLWAAVIHRINSRINLEIWNEILTFRSDLRSEILVQVSRFGPQYSPTKQIGRSIPRDRQSLIPPLSVCGYTFSVQSITCDRCCLISGQAVGTWRLCPLPRSLSVRKIRVGLCQSVCWKHSNTATKVKHRAIVSLPIHHLADIPYIL